MELAQDHKKIPGRPSLMPVPFLIVTKYSLRCVLCSCIYSDNLFSNRIDWVNRVIKTTSLNLFKNIYMYTVFPFKKNNVPPWIVSLFLKKLSKYIKKEHYSNFCTFEIASLFNVPRHYLRKYGNCYFFLKRQFFPEKNSYK